MRRRMVVLDVTQMSGDKVCVGGYLLDGARDLEPIRPICFPAGPESAWLRPAPGAVVAPFSVVELHVGRRPEGAHAPHTEDRLVPERGHTVHHTLPEQERLALLDRTCSPSASDIFGAPVLADDAGGWGRFVRAGTGVRSLGTVRATIEGVGYRHYPERGRWDYRLRFRDDAGELYQLAVVDLAFRARLDALRDGGSAPDTAARWVQHGLQRQHVYLRVGLARRWEKHPDRCYLQLTGVYGFGEG